MATPPHAGRCAPPSMLCNLATESRISSSSPSRGSGIAVTFGWHFVIERRPTPPTRLGLRREARAGTCRWWLCCRGRSLTTCGSAPPTSSQDAWAWLSLAQGRHSEPESSCLDRAAPEPRAATGSTGSPHTRSGPCQARRHARSSSLATSTTPARSGPRPPARSSRTVCVGFSEVAASGGQEVAASGGWLCPMVDGDSRPIRGQITVDRTSAQVSASLGTFL